MNALLNSADYTDATVYQAEMKQIFRRTWVFVGYTWQCANDNDWITGNLGGVDIFVQNFSGELRGFVNACSHRYSRIRCSESGNGIVQCPYHGWRFGRDGLPTAIPSKPRFDDLTPERLRSLRLGQVHVEMLGPLVFACLGQPPAALRSYLGEMAPRIETLAQAAGEPLGTVELEIAANWKLVVENTLEGYHLDWVHGKTFGRLDMAYPKFEPFGNHTISYARVSDEALRSFARVNEKFKSRPVALDGYLHTVLFPNFGIATLYGMTFALQRFVPTAPGRTRLRIDMFGTKIEGELKPSDRALLKQLYASALDFSRKVCGEDQAIVELQQLGVQARDQAGILSDEECRIAGFQREYVRMMDLPSAN
jgi:phenylpropionate dioxygenase-like ring-hydroxylating dioxygenase large terminal subunit